MIFLGCPILGDFFAYVRLCYSVIYLLLRDRFEALFISRSMCYLYEVVGGWDGDKYQRSRRRWLISERRFGVEGCY